VDIKAGDLYVRRSDGAVFRVKMIDNIKVVLESEDKSLLTITDIYGLEKSYTQKELKPTR